MRWLARAMMVAALGLLAAGCARREGGKVRLVVWGLESGEETAGLDATVAEFERRHPEIEVRLLRMGAGGTNPQKLLTSIAGGVPPDVVRQDRFTIGDWAARGAFRRLDDLIARDHINPSDYYTACWQEAVRNGHVYAMPYGTDDRVLYYNRELFRRVGLDPNRPPRTWEELVDYARRLTKRRPDGAFERIGFIPIYGRAWLYLYSWQMDGEFMSPDLRRCTLDNPQTRKALEWMVSVYDGLGGAAAVNAFSATFVGAELDPFLTGKVAMKIDGNWKLNDIARYAPQLDFAIAPAPVPAARLRGGPPFKPGEPKYITWAGGMSLAIPRGARHVEQAWEFIKWMTSPAGWLTNAQAQHDYNRRIGRPYVLEMSANIRGDEMLYQRLAPRDPKFRRALRLCIDLMRVAKFRPATFVGQRLWDEQQRAMEVAIYHKRTPAAALRDGRIVVQKELDKVLARERYPRLDWRLAVAFIAAALALLFGVVWRLARRAGPVGKLMRSEAIAGYLFAAPWIIGFLVFTMGPILVSVVLSLCDYDVLHPARFVGWLNYRDLFRDDWRYVLKALTNVAFLAGVGIPLGMMTGLSIAMLLNTRVMGMSWYRTLYYLPAVVPTVASAVLWLWMLNPYDYGVINAGWKATLTSWFRIAPPTWLSSETWAKPALVLMGLWSAGSGMIIWLAGLQGIPQHLYEAAEIDGAGAWRKFIHVTLPMLSPTIFFVMIMGTIGALQTFETIYVMTNGQGGPVDATMVPVLYLFNNAFRFFKMGYASALAWLLFWIIMFFTLLQLKLAPRWVHYEGR